VEQFKVFIALLFWGWLWGIWGLLLAIPIIGIPLDELLAEET